MPASRWRLCLAGCRQQLQSTSASSCLGPGMRTHPTVFTTITQPSAGITDVMHAFLVVSWLSLFLMSANRKQQQQLRIVSAPCSCLLLSMRIVQMCWEQYNDNVQCSSWQCWHELILSFPHIFWSQPIFHNCTSVCLQVYLLTLILPPEAATAVVSQTYTVHQCLLTHTIIYEWWPW